MHIVPAESEKTSPSACVGGGSIEKEQLRAVDLKKQTNKRKNTMILYTHTDYLEK